MKISFRTLAYGCMAIAALGMSSCEKNEAVATAEPKNVYEKVKGDSLPKIDFEKPVMDENEAPVITYLFDSSLRSTAESQNEYILDIRVKSSSKNDLPNTFWFNNNCYAKMDVDLNEKAGGKYVYAYVYSKERHSGSKLCEISSISSYSSLDPSCLASDEIPLGLNTSGKWMDLNEGAGGKYIYLKGKKGVAGVKPIKALMIASFNSKQSSKTYYDDFYEVNWERVTGDLNEKAGGKYVYMYAYRGNLVIPVRANR